MLAVTAYHDLKRTCIELPILLPLNGS